MKAMLLPDIPVGISSVYVQLQHTFQSMTQRDKGSKMEEKDRSEMLTDAEEKNHQEFRKYLVV